MDWDKILEYLEIYKTRLANITDPVIASRICQNTANELGVKNNWSKEVFRASSIAGNHWNNLQYQIDGIRETT